MKVKITDFATRYFDPKFGATKILNMSKEKVEEYINDIHEYEFVLNEKPNRKEINIISSKYAISTSIGGIFIHDGYAPFCKLLAIKNFTDAKVGSLPITLENYQYLRSGYSARREEELPVFSRWFDLPLSAPKADYLVFVLYSKEQIIKEGNEDFDADWGVVAILGQSHSDEEPMKPETMLRNALGISEGGSGYPLDRDTYLKSVAFWDKNATVG